MKANLKILVADDNTVNQKVVQAFLAKMGCQSDVAGDGLEVLKCLERESYDLILMDCHMPKMDGFEATKEILAKYPASVRPKIIALTASALPEDRA